MAWHPWQHKETMGVTMPWYRDRLFYGNNPRDMVLHCIENKVIVWCLTLTPVMLCKIMPISEYENRHELNILSIITGGNDAEKGIYKSVRRSDIKTDIGGIQKDKKAGGGGDQGST